MDRTTHTVVLCLVGGILAGCDREDVHAYRAPAPQGGTATPAPGNPHGSAPAASPTGSAAAKVTWTAPEGWAEVPTTQAMRIATFKAQGVEIAVTAFPGDVGGMLANINRWRGQIGLAAVTDADLPGIVAEVQQSPSKVSITSMTGSQGQQMLGAVVDPGDGQTWFVKATATPAEIDAIRASFEAFAKSFTMSAGVASNPAPAPAPAPAVLPGMQGMGTSDVPLAKNEDAVIEQRLVTWKAPEHWNAEANTGGIIAAGFNATNAGGSARATATSLSNDGGGTLMNINRWRDQLGLSPAADLAGSGAVDMGKGAVMVDLTNTAGSDRMISAIVPANNGSTWFFKLRGAPAAVGAEKAAFESFVKAVGLGEKD
ncbi:MAG TPA: hypothetical protein VHN77_02660 [Phycisphaerales bacterium]|nr:hypothetical protein [Phycisphaerales bacterium]